jgi:hypothetical protein
MLSKSEHSVLVGDIVIDGDTHVILRVEVSEDIPRETIAALKYEWA